MASTCGKWSFRRSVTANPAETNEEEEEEEEEEAKASRPPRMAQTRLDKAEADITNTSAETWTHAQRTGVRGRNSAYAWTTGGISGEEVGREGEGGDLQGGDAVSPQQKDSNNEEAKASSLLLTMCAMSTARLLAVYTLARLRAVWVAACEVPREPRPGAAAMRLTVPASHGRPGSNRSSELSRSECTDTCETGGKEHAGKGAHKQCKEALGVRGKRENKVRVGKCLIVCDLAKGGGITWSPACRASPLRTTPPPSRPLRRS